MMNWRVHQLLRPLLTSLWLATAAVLACVPCPGTVRAQALDLKICALGSTPTEIARIYGPVLRHNARVRHHEILEGGSAVFTGDLHGKDDLVVRTVYHRDRCVLLEYTRINAAINQSDVDLALAASAGRFTWEKGKDSTDTAKYYHRSDGKAIAQWAVGYDGSLLISAEEGDTDFGKDIGH